MNMLVLLFVSVFVGFLGSLTGLGGASLLTPLLVLFGVPVKEAIAAGMVTIIATSSGAALSCEKSGLTNVRVAMYLQMFTIVGAVAGATVTAAIPPVFLYFAFAGFLLTSFVRFRFPDRNPGQQDRISRWLGLRGSYYDQFTNQTIEYKVNHAIPGGIGMTFAGFAAGMLGIGAGAFTVTVQQNILKLPYKVSSATSNFIIGMTALAGASVYLFSGLLNLTLIAPMAVGTTLGALVGGRVLNRISNRRLRLLFFVVVSIAIVQMLYKGVASL